MALGVAASATLAVLLLAGCTSSPPASAPPTDRPSATSSRSDAATRTPPPPIPSPAPSTAAPPSSPSGTPRDLSFSSAIYPYSIVLPPEPFEPGPVAVVPPPGTWKPASQAWDGSSVISPSNPQPLDFTFDGDGDELFVVGHETQDDLDAFVSRMIPNYAMWHGCSRTPMSRSTQVDGAAAVLIASPCGRDGGSAFAVRLFVVHEGFGLVFNTRTFRSVSAEAQIDRLTEYVSKVDLRP